MDEAQEGIMELLQKASKKTLYVFLQKPFFCWLVGLLLLLSSSSLPAFTQSPSITTLTVDRGLLTITANNMPLSEILARICQTAGIETRLQSPLSSPVSVSFKDVPLEEGLLRLTKGYSTALFYRSENSTLTEKKHHNIVKIWVSETRTAPGTTSDGITPLLQTTGEDSSQDIPHAKQTGNDFQTEKKLPASISPANNTGEDGDEVRYWSQILQQDSDLEQLKLAIGRLAQIGSDEALSAMSIALGNEEVAVRQLVVENLGQSESSLSSQLLGQVLFGDPDYQIRLWAVEQLAQQNNELSRFLLSDAAQKQGGEIGKSARKALQIP